MVRNRMIYIALFASMSLTSIAQLSTRTEVEVKNFRKDPRFQEQIDLNNVNYKLMAEIIFHLTNEIRIKNNLEPLTYSDELSMAATMHARDMVKYDFFSHFNEKDASKKTPNDRARLCNIANPALAENIIEGYGLKYQSNHSVFLRGKGKFSETSNGEIIPPHTYMTFGEVQLTGWMNSKDHRKNILAKEAIQIGIGAASFVNKSFNDMPTFYVVQNFQWYTPIKKQD